MSSATQDSILANAGSATRLQAAIEEGLIREIEIHWPDHQGHARGKRIEAVDFLERASTTGFAFCNAALCWDVEGDVKEGLRLSGWSTGFPDLFARPDLETYREIPWRSDAGFVSCDVLDHHGELIRTAPRAVLKRVLARLRELGYEAEVGVEIEFHLLGEGGKPLAGGIQAYSIQKLAELDHVMSPVIRGLRGFVELEGANTEYGPGQVEVNLRHTHALAAADQAARFKYATRELVRQAGATATFMAKPFGDQAGNSAHLHVSLWRDGRPAFAPVDGAENDLHRHAIAGVLRHLPGIVLYGAPTVNSYKRFAEETFAPTTATWGSDNRTVAIRSLVESPSASRLELRIGGADAQPHWAIASLLAAVIAGIEDEADPGARGEGNMYGQGAPLPRTLGDAVTAARADQRLIEILGVDAVHDYTTIADAEWDTFLRSVTGWERDRYLELI